MDQPKDSVLIRTTYFQARALPLRPQSRLIGRIRPTTRRSSSTVEWVAEELPSLGFEEAPLGDFFDVAAQDAGMFRRFEGAPDRVRLRFQDQHETVHQPRVGLLLSETGHYVLEVGLEHRLSTVSNPTGREASLTIFSDLSAQSQEQSEDNPQRGSWRLEAPLGQAGGPEADLLVCSASVRRAFDLVGFALHEALLGRDTYNPLEQWSRTWSDSETRSRNMHEACEVATPYVATWGYHAEVQCSDSQEDRPISHDEIVETMLSARGIAQEDVAAPVISDEVRWLIGDFESIRITTERTNMGNISPDALNALGLIEYLAYRRGVVTLVQRDMLRCSINVAEIKREQVADWDWSLATTTDDYVLAGWNVGLLRRVRAASRNQLGIWDLGHREEQARQHLGSFKEQFQAEQGRLSTALSLIFGIIAYASLLPGISFVLAWMFDSSSVTDVPLDRPVAFTVVNLALLGLLLVLSFRLVRRAKTLRPPNRSTRA